MASSSSSIDPKSQNPTKTPTPIPPSNQPQYHQTHPKPSTPSPQIPYPVASSGRGYLPKTYRSQSTTDQISGIRNAPQFLNQGRPNFVVNNNNNHSTNSPQTGVGSFNMRPPPRFVGGNGVGPRGTTSPSIYNHNNNKSQAAANGFRDSRDGIRDDTVVLVNHRKVRLSDGASLYALCRSWVRNGLPKETQPQSGEGLKLLPRPLPTNVANSQIPDKNGNSEEEEKKEDPSSIAAMSARELLQTHVKRAKKIRARLRKERLHRIDRYKQRLALLLPPPEPIRNEPPTAN